VIRRRRSSGENRAVTPAVMNASRVHPATSLTAAAEIVIAPRRVRVRSYSIMMRPRVGTAVIENAVAMKSA
jgi:hypothetical protein